MIYDVVVVERDANEKEVHVELVRTHTLYSEAMITRDNMEKSISPHRRSTHTAEIREHK